MARCKRARRFLLLYGVKGEWISVNHGCNYSSNLYHTIPSLPASSQTECYLYSRYTTSTLVLHR